MRERRVISGKGLVAVALWGFSFVLTRVALRSFSPFGLVAVRLLTGTAFLLLVVRLGGDRTLPERDDRKTCVILGLILGLHLLMQAYGLQYTSAINTGWIIGFIPVTIAIGAHMLGKQRIEGIGWVGILVGTGGVLLVTMSSSPDFAHARFGDLLQVLSCLTWTAFTLISVNPIARSGALRVTAMASGVATVVVVGALPWTGVFDERCTMEALFSVLCLGVFCSGIAYKCWSQAVAEQGPARTGSLLYLEPFFTLGAAAAFLHEQVTVHACFGGLGVLFGVCLVARGTHVSTRPISPRSNE